MSKAAGSNTAKLEVKDLSPCVFPSLSWGPGEAVESLDKLSQYATAEVKRYIEWYYAKRKNKKNWGYLLRFFAILSTAAAGLIPILAEIFENEAGKPSLNPSWATFALAIAALLVLLDKFGGFTSGWVRYITTGQELGRLLENFRFDWENIKIGLTGQDTPAPGQVTHAVSQCKDFIMKARDLIRQETGIWVTEFQNVLKDLERTAKAVAKMEEQRKLASK